MENIRWTDCVKNETQNEKVLHKVERKRTSYIQYNEGGLTGLVTSDVGSAF